MKYIKGFNATDTGPDYILSTLHFDKKVPIAYSYFPSANARFQPLTLLPFNLLVYSFFMDGRPFSLVEERTASFLLSPSSIEKSPPIYS